MRNFTGRRTLTTVRHAWFAPSATASHPLILRGGRLLVGDIHRPSRQLGRRYPIIGITSKDVQTILAVLAGLAAERALCSPLCDHFDLRPGAS